MILSFDSQSIVFNRPTQESTEKMAVRHTSQNPTKWSNINDLNWSIDFFNHFLVKLITFQHQSRFQKWFQIVVWSLASIDVQMSSTLRSTSSDLYRQNSLCYALQVESLTFPPYCICKDEVPHSFFSWELLHSGTKYRMVPSLNTTVLSASSQRSIATPLFS